MKKIFLAGFIFVALSSCKSNHSNANTVLQLDKDSIEYINRCVEFIKEVRKENVSDTNYILEDKPSLLLYYNCIDDLLKDTETFTKEELNFIKNKEYFSISKWTKEMFPNIKFVSSDTVKAIFSNNANGWTYFYKNFGRKFSTFSVPIFLRNNTYCLFYSDNHCGWLCGGGSLILYKKENGKWVEIKSYCNWIS
jgi:hypothetical protein